MQGLSGTRLRDTALEYQREIELLNRERKLNQVRIVFQKSLLPAFQHSGLSHNIQKIHSKDGLFQFRVATIAYVKYSSLL